MKTASFITALFSLLLLSSCKKEMPGVLEYRTSDYDSTSSTTTYCYKCFDLPVGTHRTYFNYCKSGELCDSGFVYWRFKSCWLLGYREEVNKRIFENKEGCSVPGKNGYFANH